MANSITFGRKAVILTVVGAVFIMFVTSFVYRMNHPNLFVQAKTGGQQQAENHDHDGDGIEDDGPNAGKPVGGAMGGAMGGGAMSKVREYMAAVEENPNDVEALMGLGNSFLMMRAWDRALEPLTKANKIDPKNTSVLKGIGIVHFNKQDFDKAAESYLAILELDENDTLSLFNLGVINKHYFKKFDVARKYFEKVLALEKDDAEMIKLAKQELRQ